jgi:hypothetical protein
MHYAKLTQSMVHMLVHIMPGASTAVLLSLQKYPSADAVQPQIKGAHNTYISQDCSRAAGSPSAMLCELIHTASSYPEGLKFTLIINKSATSDSTVPQYAVLSRREYA